MSKIVQTQKKTTWSTWEELLLAFSVKRHGLRDWDSVAMELRRRSSVLLTPQNCREKYRDLHRRFTNNDAIVDEDDGGGGGGDVVIPWLEDLRQLRVAELKQEVHRHDLSIQSLQSKVKRMEEEREQSMKERQGADIKPDLEDSRRENSVNDENNGGKTEEIVRKVGSGGNSDHENRSLDESNSVENRGTGDNRKPDPVHVADAKPDPRTKPVREDSCKDSSNRHESSKTIQENKVNDVSKNERKEGSDVESSVSLTKKRRKRGEVIGGEQVAAQSPAIAKKSAGAMKSEPLVALLDVIRSHKYGSVFKRRLQIQKTDKYKSIIRRHVDLETVQTRINNGSYTSCPAKFYVDLLVLFNNAIVFFPKSSPESVAAHELRRLVLHKSTNAQPEPMPESKPEKNGPDSLIAKCKPTVAPPIVICRKRSSSIKVADEDDGTAELKVKERPPVTGVRSMRRTSKSRLNHSPPNKLQTAADEEAAKTEKINKKKKEEVSNSSSTDKKRGSAGVWGRPRSTIPPFENKKRCSAADFLKRITKSSPTKTEMQNKSSNNDSGGGDSERKQLKRKTTEKKEAPTVGKNAGTKKSTEKSLGRPRRGGTDATSNKFVKGRNTTKDDSSKRSKNITKDDSSKRPMKRSKR